MSYRQRLLYVCMFLLRIGILKCLGGVCVFRVTSAQIKHFQVELKQNKWAVNFNV